MRHPVAGQFVCFSSSFRQDGSRGGTESPNITHVVLTGSTRTLCGRAYWFDADCLRCDRTLQRLRGAS